MTISQYLTGDYYSELALSGLSGAWRRSRLSAEQRALDKLVERAMRRSLQATIERSFERSDAYVWLLRVAAERAVTQEIGRIEYAVRDAIGRKNYEYNVVVYPDPLRVELEKSQPDKVALATAKLNKLRVNECLFVPGVRQRVSDCVPQVMSLADAEVAQILIGGSTGSGKTMLAVAILTTLALLNSPRVVSMLVIDPKQVDIGNTDLQRLPHLAHPIITDPGLGVSAIYRLAAEMKRRLDDIGMCTRQGQRWVMPGRIFCYVDELQELVENDSQVSGVLAWIAAQGRGLGIHLCLATQRPTVDVVTGHLRSNLPCRIGGWVRSADDARIVTGLPESGLEKLHGSGMFRLYTRAMGQRVQGYYVDLDKDLPGLVASIQTKWAGEPSLWTIDALTETEDAPEVVVELVKAGAEPVEADLFTMVKEKMVAGEEVTLTQLDEMRKAVEGKGFNRKTGRAFLDKVKEELGDR